MTNAPPEKWKCSRCGNVNPWRWGACGQCGVEERPASDSPTNGPFAMKFIDNLPDLGLRPKKPDGPRPIPEYELGKWTEEAKKWNDEANRYADWVQLWRQHVVANALDDIRENEIWDQLSSSEKISYVVGTAFLDVVGIIIDGHESISMSSPEPFPPVLNSLPLDED